MRCPFCVVSRRDERREQSYVTAEHLSHIPGRRYSSAVYSGVLRSSATSRCRAIAGRAHGLSWIAAGAAKCRRPWCRTAITSSISSMSCAGCQRMKLLVSLDAVGDKHDAIRRTPGAFARIAEGLKSAARYDDLRERLSIAAIMMPGRSGGHRRADQFHRRKSHTAAHSLPPPHLLPQRSAHPPRRSPQRGMAGDSGSAGQGEGGKGWLDCSSPTSSPLWRRGRTSSPRAASNFSRRKSQRVSFASMPPAALRPSPPCNPAPRPAFICPPIWPRSTVFAERVVSTCFAHGQPGRLIKAKTLATQ